MNYNSEQELRDFKRFCEVFGYRGTFTYTEGVGYSVVRTYSQCDRVFRSDYKLGNKEIDVSLVNGREIFYQGTILF